MGVYREGEAEFHPCHGKSFSFKMDPRRLNNFTYKMNPPLVLGPIIHNLQSLDALNTSNQRIRDIMTGKAKDTIPETGTFIWVDVRDLALAHVKAAELEEAGGKRYFLTAGYFSNREIANIIRKNFPDRASNVPESAKGGDYPKGGVYFLSALNRVDANLNRHIQVR